MIDPSVVEAYNARQTVDLNNIKKMTPGEQDRVIHNRDRLLTEYAIGKH